MLLRPVQLCLAVFSFQSKRDCTPLPTVPLLLTATRLRLLHRLADPRFLRQRSNVSPPRAARLPAEELFVKMRAVAAVAAALACAAGISAQSSSSSLSASSSPSASAAANSTATGTAATPDASSSPAASNATLLAQVPAYASADELPMNSTLQSVWSTDRARGTLTCVC